MHIYLQGSYRFLDSWHLSLRHDQLDSGSPQIGLADNYNINIAGIRKQPICAPNVVDQDALLLQLKDLDGASEALEKRVAASKEIKKQLFAEMWGA